MPTSRTLLILLSVAALASAQNPAAPLPLMPLPAQVKLGEGYLRVDSSFRVRLTGFDEPRLHRAALRLIARLSKQTGLSLAPDPTNQPNQAALTLSCDHAGKPVQAVGEDESYHLEIASSGAKLTAPQPLGLLRGMETFLQLVEPGPDGFDVPAMSVQDQPRFPWRGLVYDVARHFMPEDQVKRTLDAMAAVKLNVLHWHLSDNQGFRVESKIFPRLQELGSNGQYYTQAQIRGIVAYARDRGIRVVPEFDMPGHATALLVAYPALAVEPAPRETDHLFGVLDPVIDPTKAAVYTFLDRFIGEMSALFPDAYFHIGGDEVNGRLWRESVAISAFKQARGMLPTATDPDVNRALQAMFNTRLHAILQKHGKFMEGWDEIIAPDLPKSILMQSWRGPKSLADAVKLGYQAILSSGYYVDLSEPASSHYLVDPLDGEAAALTPDEQKRILGGEAAMWSEWVTPETMDSRVWPRTAAIAERLWSPPQVRDVPDMYRRLEIVSQYLEWLGLTHRSWQLPMLQRLAGAHDVEPLRVLSEALEPVKQYDRAAFGPYTTATPLIRLVDAVPPESPAALRFTGMVDRALRDGSQWDAVRAQLLAWRANHARLGPVLDNNELLSGVAALSDQLRDLAAVGLEALDAIQSGRKLGPQWKAHCMTRITKSKSTAAALTIVVTDPITRLIRSAAD
jgi:hexosaminidase